MAGFEHKSGVTTPVDYLSTFAINPYSIAIQFKWHVSLKFQS